MRIRSIWLYTVGYRPPVSHLHKLYFYRLTLTAKTVKMPFLQHRREVCRSTYIPEAIAPFSKGFVSESLRLVDRRDLINPLYHHVQHPHQLIDDLRVGGGRGEGGESTSPLHRAGGNQLPILKPCLQWKVDQRLWREPSREATRGTQTHNLPHCGQVLSTSLFQWCMHHFAYNVIHLRVILPRSYSNRVRGRVSGA